MEATIVLKLKEIMSRETITGSNTSMAESSLQVDFQIVIIG